MYGLSEWLLIVQTPFVIAALLAALSAGAVILRVAGKRRWAPYLAASLPTAVFAALVALYAGNIVSRRWLGVSFDHGLARLWLQDWWGGQQMSSLFSSGVLIAVVSLCCCALLFEVVIWARALHAAPLQQLWQPSAAAALALVTSGYAAPRLEVADADPFVAFVRGNKVDVDVRQQMIFDRLRRDEPLVRAAYGQHTFDRKNVIVITVDSLRPDHMQVYGYGRATTPFLNKLNIEGKLRKAQLATSTCAESNCGILSTLFSKTLHHQVTEDFSLFTLLKDQGYDTHFIVSGNHNWMGLREMYGNELTSYFDGRDSSRWGWSDDRVLLEGLDRVDASHRPAFFYFHLMSAHILGAKDDRFRRFKPAISKLDMQAMFRREYDRARVINSYDNGVLQADDTLRQLFEALDRKGYLRNSIVVILADHGEALAERAAGMYGHINWLYQELITIPLLIYEDSPAEYRGLEYANQLDVAPTIVDRLGLPIPESWEGVSLLRDAQPRQTMHQTKLIKPCFAIVDYTQAQTWKYTQCAANGHEELYDLTRDPGEKYSLMWKADPAQIERFRTALTDWRSK